MQTIDLQAALENTRRTIALSRRLRLEADHLSAAHTTAAIAFADMAAAEKRQMAGCLLESRELLRGR